jgi:hypothetical protein
MAKKRIAEATEDGGLTEKQIKQLSERLLGTSDNIEEAASELFDCELDNTEYSCIEELIFQCFECDEWKHDSDQARDHPFGNDPTCRDCVAARGTAEEQAAEVGLKVTGVNGYHVENEQGPIGHIVQVGNDGDEIPLWSLVHPSLLHILGHNTLNTRYALEELTNDPGEIYLLVRVKPTKPKAITKDALDFISNEVAKATQKSLPKTYKLDRIDVNSYYPGVCSGASLTPELDRQFKAAMEADLKAVAKRRQKAAEKAKLKAKKK